MSIHQLAVWAITWNQTLDDFTRDRVEGFVLVHAKHWIYQLEQGEEKGILHYQGYVSLKKKMRKPTLIELIHQYMPGAHVSAGSLHGVASRALKDYCMKSDTKVDGPWMDKKESEDQRIAALPHKVGCEPDASQYTDVRDHPRPFQVTLESVLTGPVHPRHIHWVSDPEGNSGKSVWANWMEEKYGTNLIPYGSAGNCCSLVVKMGRCRSYIFTFPRSKPKESTLEDAFNVMEQVKDGRVTNLKYEASKLRMASPHVIVLANYMPTMSEARGLSADRWRFHSIDHATWELKDTHPIERISDGV